MFNRTAISHKSSKQSGVSTSSVEAEYIALATTATEVLWIRTLLQELGFNASTATIIDSDNDGAVNITENGIVSHRTRHIDVKHHFIKHNIESNIIALRHCSSTNNTADTLTKALPYFIIIITIITHNIYLQEYYTHV